MSDNWKSYYRINSEREAREVADEIERLQQRYTDTLTEIAECKFQNRELRRENEELRAKVAFYNSPVDAVRNNAKQESAEPFGYWHQGETYEESEFFLASESGDVRCDNCVALYTHPQKQESAEQPVAWRLYGPHMDTTPFTENPAYAKKFNGVPLYTTPTAAIADFKRRAVEVCDIFIAANKESSDGSNTLATAYAQVKQNIAALPLIEEQTK